ncbi:hypothetical protein [Paracidovorax citrulli]|uniref:hypothetical protein n=1 Tax=Paracidovorax citrulli TaxID=80869 RepID=UPI003FA69FA8
MKLDVRKHMQGPESSRRSGLCLSHRGFPLALLEFQFASTNFKAQGIATELIKNGFPDTTTGGGGIWKTSPRGGLVWSRGVG